MRNLIAGSLFVLYLSCYGLTPTRAQRSIHLGPGMRSPVV